MRRTKAHNMRREFIEAEGTHRAILAHIEEHGVHLPTRCPDWVANVAHGPHSFEDGVKIHCPGALGRR